MSTQQEGTVYLKLHVRAPKLPTQKVSSGELVPQHADEQIRVIAESAAKLIGGNADHLMEALRKIGQAAGQAQDQGLVNTFTRARPSRLPVGDYPGQVPAFRNRRPQRL